jgi:parvulin-like peptidyl-prolyl isomerase
VKSQLVGLEPDQYHLRLIDIKDRSKAQKALDSLNKGVPFETVALTQSEDPNSQPKSGDIGFVPAPQIPEPILAAVKDLKAGEYTKRLIQAEVPARNATATPVGVPTETRYFLAQQVEKKPGRVPTLEEVKPLVEMLILEQKDRTANQRVQQTVLEFVRKADIQVNLKQYQDIAKRLKTPAPRPGAGASPPPSAPPTGP